MRIGTALHTPQNPNECESMVEQLAARGVNTILVYVKTWSGTTNYPSAIAHTTKGYEDGKALERILACARERGIACEAWHCMFTESASSRFFELHPDCRAASREGSADPNEAGAVWPCPARPETHEYLLSLCREALDRYPQFDRLHLDYIRYPWSNGMFCGCAYCRDNFKKRYGFDLAEDVLGGSADERPGFRAFVDWRCSYIRDVVIRAGCIAREHGKEITASVFPYYPSIIFDLGQDWISWCGDDLVDAVCVMNYNRHPYLVRQFTTIHTAIMPKCRALLCEAIWARKGMKAPEAEALAQAAMQKGVQGLFVFPATDFVKLPESVFSEFRNCSV